MSNFLCEGFVTRSVFSRNKLSVSEFLLTVMGQARFVFNLEAAPWASLPVRPVSSSVCTQVQMVDPIPGPEAHAPPSWGM